MKLLDVFVRGGGAECLHSREPLDLMDGQKMLKTELGSFLLLHTWSFVNVPVLFCRVEQKCGFCSESGCRHQLQFYSEELCSK